MKLILFLLFFTLFSCGGSVEKSDVRISLGAISGADSFTGGLLVTIRNLDTQKEIVRTSQSGEDIVLELANGLWEFRALGWDGAQKLEGNIFCAKTTAELTGEDFSPDLNATQANCISADTATSTGGVEPIIAGKFPLLSVSNCLDIKGYLDIPGFTIPSDAQCDESLMQGTQKSFQIEVMQFMPENIFISGIRSACQNVTPQFGRTDTAINLPAGYDIDNLQYKIHFFKDVNCSGGVKEYTFFEGAIENTVAFTNEGPNQGVVLKSNNRTMFLLNEDACVGDQLTNQPFALGSTDSKSYMICTKEQWANIAKGPGNCPAEIGHPAGSMNCEADATYILGQDIDFQNSVASISDPFKGNFRGANKTIFNANSPLFDEITNNIEDVRLSNLNIISASVVNTIPQRVGILARKISDSGTNRIEIDHISILDSSITDNAATNSQGVGGLIGEIDFSSASAGDERAEIRYVYSNTDLNIVSTAPNQPIGGLVGKVMGSSSDGNITFEGNRVGMKILSSLPDQENTYDHEDFSESININISETTNAKYVGGLIGEFKNAEVRIGNIAYSSITSKGSTGGIIGFVNGATSNNSNRISNSIGIVKFNPSTNAAGIGGIIGSVAGGSKINIMGSHGEVRIGDSINPITAFQVDQVGGILGGYQENGTSTGVHISDSRGFLDTYSKGEFYGGIVGRFNCINCNNPNSDDFEIAIKRSIGMGFIMDESSAGLSTLTVNKYRGGLAGYGQRLKAKESNSYIEIEGHQKLGGAFGESVDSIVEKFNATGKIHVNSGSVGGVVGYFSTLNTAAFSPLITDAKVKMEVNFDNNNGLDCNSVGCGQLFGFLSDGDGVPHTNKVIAQTLFKNSNGTPLTNANSICGSSTANCDTVSNIYTDASSGTCSSLGTSFFDSTISSECELDFFDKILRFGVVLKEENNDFSHYKMGSIIEPYELETTDDWDQIGSNSFLLSKSFDIVNDLDFGGLAPNPIGSSSPFMGTMFSENNKVISNFDYSPVSATHGGLFYQVHQGFIGLRENPLRIENFDLYCDGSITTGCGIIGLAKNANIHMIVEDGRIDIDSAGAVGGLIGQAEDRVELSNSGFSGFIDAPSAVEVGGLIGSLTNTSNTSVTIESSYAKPSFLIGQNFVGGLIGKAGLASPSSPNQLSIRRSYVWVDPDNINPGDDIVGAQVGGLVGAVTDKIEIEESYVDYSTAQINSANFYQITKNIGSTTNHNTQDIAFVGNFGNSDGVWAPVEFDNQEQLNDFFNSSDKEEWKLDAGELLLRWEVEGFEHY